MEYSDIVNNKTVELNIHNITVQRGYENFKCTSLPACISGPVLWPESSEPRQVLFIFCTHKKLNEILDYNGRHLDC